MSLTYRGVSYLPHTDNSGSRSLTLTYRGVTFERIRSGNTRSRSFGLIYRGQKYHPEETVSTVDQIVAFAL